MPNIVLHSHPTLFEAIRLEVCCHSPSSLSFAHSGARAAQLYMQPDHSGYLLPNTTAALRVLDATACSNVGLQLDLYHLQVRCEPFTACSRGNLGLRSAQVSEGDLHTRVKELLPRTFHIQARYQASSRRLGTCSNMHRWICAQCASKMPHR